MSRFARLGQSLYEGTVSVDFVGRKWLVVVDYHN